MILSESYKKRIQKLAGILSEDIYDFTDDERKRAFKDFDKRMPFSKDLMVKAIKEGWEVGINFQSNNDKYKMPVAKARIIYPVAMGLSKKGNLVIRAFHAIGQSEKAARKTGRRSQEVKNEWRLFKASNIKNMWFTGDFFKLENISGYKEIGDKGMTVVEIQAKKSEVSKFQKQFYQNLKATEQKPETVIVKNKPIGKVAKEPQNPEQKQSQTINTQVSQKSTDQQK